MSERHDGTLKFWNIERGFGFISTPPASTRARA
jgi:cold shock CspA family protein